MSAPAAVVNIHFPLAIFPLTFPWGKGIQISVHPITIRKRNIHEIPLHDHPGRDVDSDRLRHPEQGAMPWK